MGGLDWSGLEPLIALFGISDVEGLMHRLIVIKTHTPPEQPK
jgi:hypothetical protein